MSCLTLLLLLLFLFTLFHLLTPNHAQIKDCTPIGEHCWNCNSNFGNYSANSLYRRNLNNLLLSFPSVTLPPNSIGFYNLSSPPQVVNKVHVMALCRGDLDSASCLSCLNTSSRMILEQCPTQMEAILWAAKCMVRYSNRSISQVLEQEPSRILISPNHVPYAQVFKNVLKPLLDKLINESSIDVRKYGTGNAEVPNTRPIYALVQCTPDLAEKECRACLLDSSSRLDACCAGVNGARILKPSCTLRFESGPFYDKNDTAQKSTECSDSGEYCWNCLSNDTATSPNTFIRNVKELLSSFSSDKARSENGFFNSSFGEDTNRVNAIALCRGDLSPETCRSCVSRSSQNILDRCPDTKEAILWSELCMVRYSNNSIFSARQDDPRKYILSSNNASEPSLFGFKLNPLLDDIISKAAFGDSSKKYGSGQATVPGYETIYAVAQCTPDLDKDKCMGCLNEVALLITQPFDGKQAWRILKPSCNLRYEVSPFFNARADQLPPSPSFSKVSSGQSNTTRKAVLAAVIPSITIGAVIITIMIFLKLKRKRKENLEITDISRADSLQFDFNTIMKATDDFSIENKLGEGGFGAVYKIKS